MKELVIVSGKGGTGKTSLAGAFAVLAGNKVLVDCDVDAANLHLLLNPRLEKEEPFYGLSKAVIDRKHCLECELCRELCQFGAIRNFSVSELACEGCGVCFHACPDRAIRMVEHQAGWLYVSRTRYGPLIHAQLGIAEGNSGKLVSAVRQRAREIAEKEGYGLIITDGPPGIGCPVIACLAGVDVVLVVTEPTLSGRHDLERVLWLVEHFQEKAVVCVNKWDLSPENTREIEKFCRQKEISLIGKIPYDPAVNEAVRRKIPVVLHNSGAAGEEIVSLWDKLAKMLS